MQIHFTRQVQAPSNNQFNGARETISHQEYTVGSSVYAPDVFYNGYINSIEAQYHRDLAIALNYWLFDKSLLDEHEEKEETTVP